MTSMALLETVHRCRLLVTLQDLPLRLKRQFEVKGSGSCAKLVDFSCAVVCKCYGELRSRVLRKIAWRQRSYAVHVVAEGLGAGDVARLIRRAGCRRASA